MATPVLGNVPTTIDDAESTNGWTMTSSALDGDLKKEGSNAVFGILRNDLSVAFYDITADSGSLIDMTGLHVRLWWWFNSVGLLDIEANGGMEFFMDDGTNRAFWVIAGSDTYAGGWRNTVLDCDRTPDSGSFDKTIVIQWGLRYNRTSAPRNVDNTWMDYIRHGDGYFATGGTSGDEIDLTGIEAVDLAAGYGIVEQEQGIYFGWGDIVIGDGSTTTWFEMLGDVLVFADALVATGLYGLSGVGTGCRINIDKSVLRSAGTTDAIRFILDLSNADLLVANLTDSFVNRASTSAFKSGQNISGTTFDDCGQITHGGANMNGCTISSSDAAAGTGAVLYNESADPDGETDNMVFTQGAAAHSAFEFGTAVTSNITLRNIDFVGFGSTDDVDGAIFVFLATSGALNLNLVGCTTDGTSFSVDDSIGSLVVTVVEDPVTLTVNTVDAAGDAVGSAEVHVTPSDTSGPLPFEEAVTITRSGSTATVAHTGHGFSNGQLVMIRGPLEDEYRGVQIVANQSVNAYDYTVSGSPTTPSVGTRLVHEQDETFYNNSPTTEGIFSGGTGHAVNDVLTMDKNVKVTVDSHESGTVITFTVDVTDSLDGTTNSDTLTQLSTTGSGIDFTLSPDDDNLTVTATAVIISGTSDGSGVISDTRTYSGNQPIQGYSRKATAQPFLQEGVISGIIDSGNGLTTNAVMISDE